MSTTSFTTVVNGQATDAQHVNQFVDILTGAVGAPGITVTSLTVLGTVSIQSTGAINTAALSGTQFATTSTTGDNIAIQAGALGSIGANHGAVIITANPASNPSNDATVDIQLLPLVGVVDFHYAANAVGGGSTATLGTIGGSGPTAAAQDSWLKVQVNGVARWIPVWH